MVFFVELVASDLGSPKSPSMPPVELFRFALKAISEPSNCQENSWVLNLKSFLGANRNVFVAWGIEKCQVLNARIFLLDISWFKSANLSNFRMYFILVKAFDLTFMHWAVSCVLLNEKKGPNIPLLLKVSYMDTNSDIQPMSLISFSFVSLNADIFRYTEFKHTEISPEMSTICKFVEYWV